MTKLKPHRWFLEINFLCDQIWYRAWAQGTPRPKLPRARQMANIPEELLPLTLERQFGVETDGFLEFKLLNAEHLEPFERLDLSHFFQAISRCPSPLIFGVRYSMVQTGSIRLYTIEAPVQPRNSEIWPKRSCFRAIATRASEPCDRFPVLRQPQSHISVDGVHLGMSLTDALEQGASLEQVGFSWNDGCVYEVTGYRLHLDGQMLSGYTDGISWAGERENPQTELSPSDRIRQWIQAGPGQPALTFEQFQLSASVSGAFTLLSSPPSCGAHLSDLCCKPATIGGCAVGMTTDQCRALVDSPPLRHQRGDLEVWLFEPWGEHNDPGCEARLRLTFLQKVLVAARGNTLEIGGESFPFSPPKLPKEAMLEMLLPNLKFLFPFHRFDAQQSPYLRLFSPEIGLGLGLHENGRVQWILEKGQIPTLGWNPYHP